MILSEIKSTAADGKSLKSLYQFAQQIQFMGEPTSAAGALVINHCPLCGERVHDSDSQEPLALNIRHTCPECKQKFIVRGSSSA